MKEEDIVYLASAGYDHTIRFWSPHEGKCTRVIQHSSSQVNDLKITPDKKFLAAASFQHEDSKWLFSGGEDCVTRVWDLRHRRNQSQRMHESESAVNSVKLHQNQFELFIGQQHGHINIWDIRYSDAIPMVRLNQQHPSNFTGVQCLSLNPIDDMLAAIDNVGNVHIYSPAQTLTLFRSWKAHSRYGIKCLFSPNGKYLVTTSADHTAKIWKTCDILEYNPDREQDYQSQSFDAISTTLAAALTLNASTPTFATPTSTTPTASSQLNPEASDTTSIQLQNDSASPVPSVSPTNTNTTDQHQLKPYKVLSTELQRWVWDVAFSADSQFLITASSDSIVRLWHLETAEIRREYTGHQKAVTALAFSD